MNVSNWQPLSVAEIKKLLRDYKYPWWIAGGYCLELFAGRKIREHKDIDVAIFRKDQLQMQAFLKDWDICKTAKTELISWNSGEYLELGNNQVWCRKDSQSAWAFEIMFMESSESNWIFRRNNSITRPISELGQLTDDGVPYLTPEIQLLFKAREDIKEKDQIDFDVIAPLLSINQKRWLLSSLETIHPKGHSWISKLLPLL